MKSGRAYLFLLALVLCLTIYAEATAPRPVDWSPSYSSYHKIPHGAYALYELLRPTLPELRTTDLTIYGTLDTFDSATPTNYLIFNSWFYPNELDVEALCRFVAAGNTALIAATSFDRSFMDSFGIEIDMRVVLSAEVPDEFFFRDTVRMNFVNPKLRASPPYALRVGRFDYWFSSVDTATTTLLGWDDRYRTNFIRVAHGEGALFLSTVPNAFTNYNVLSGRNSEYAFKALSYLPAQRTIWDEYYKDGSAASAEASSPLRFVLRNESLRWVYILAGVGVALFIFVYARRRQRAIPIVVPPSNTTLEFAETVGRLYFQNGDHRDIAAKKAAYFHEYLRSRLGLQVSDVESGLYRRVSERAGVGEDIVRSIFGRIQYVHRAADFDEGDLKGLNADLESFYSNSKR